VSYSDEFNGWRARTDGSRCSSLHINQDTPSRAVTARAVRVAARLSAPGQGSWLDLGSDGWVLLMLLPSGTSFDLKRRRSVYRTITRVSHAGPAQCFYSDGSTLRFERSGYYNDSSRSPRQS